MVAVKIYGMPASTNCMGPVLLAMHSGAGGMEFCNLMEGAHMKPEFLKMNPFHKVPTMEDGDFRIGESCSILRYLALKYKPEFYPASDPEVCGMIDFAMDSFVNEVYKDYAKTVYVQMGFAQPNDDQTTLNDNFVKATELWMGHFVKPGEFVCGKDLSIADFKVAPFLYSITLPQIKKFGIKQIDAVESYVDKFMSAVPEAKMLSDAGGYSVAEFIASR